MKRIAVGDANAVDLLEGCPRTSGSRWNGLILYELRAGSGELPEGYLIHHAVVVMPQAPKSSELYIPGEGWKPVKNGRSLVSYLPAGLPYATRWQGHVHSFCVDLSPHFVRSVQDPDSFRALELCAHVGETDALIEQAVLALGRDVQQAFPLGRLYGEHVGAAMVSQLLRRWGTTVLLRPRRRIAAHRFKHVRDYIHAHLGGDLSLLSLSALAEMGVDHFIRSFKQATGFTPHQYILRERIDQAKLCLKDRRRSVMEVALQSGFSDYGHFSKLFSREVGLSPAAYRDTMDG
jgi:AraC family transcriptional regulator